MIYYHPPHLVDFFRNSAKFLDASIAGPRVDPPFQKKITICTTCMNRLHDLKETYIKNINDNKDYANLEWLLLDYNSTDGLEQWAKKNLSQYIESGKVVFYRTEQPSYFHPNHSRNVSFRLATGDLIANVDSDNFTKKCYARRLNQCASVAEEKLLIVPDNFMKFGSSRMKLKGRFCLYRKDIERLRGFDEDLDEGFGNDDLNFVFRAMNDRFTLVRFEETFTDRRIETTNSDRVKFVINKNYEEGRDNNFEIMQDKLCRGITAVNPNHWGQAAVVKNFKEIIQL